MNATASSGLILRGIQSSGGKTAVTCMLLAALAERGLTVQPFKVGPDFIDPGYHRRLAGIASRNLDAWMMGKRRHRARGGCARRGKDFDRRRGDGTFRRKRSCAQTKAATMELARFLDWPSCWSSRAPRPGAHWLRALRGFVEDAGHGRIAGVILNQVSGSGHADYLRRRSLRSRFPCLESCRSVKSWPGRKGTWAYRRARSGHFPPARNSARLAEKHLDLPRILAMLLPAPAQTNTGLAVKHLRIAVARDEAFHFYYESNLDYLRGCGAELVEFSPIHDCALPECNRRRRVLAAASGSVCGRSFAK